MKRVGNYELGEYLGEGSYGKVRAAVDLNTRDEYAIKILEKRKIKQDDLIDNLRKEIVLMKHIAHDNVVRLVEVLASNSKIYLVMEIIRGGDMFDKIKDEGSMNEQ